MRACEHSLVSLSLWRLEVNLRCCSLDAVHLVYRDRFSYWPGAHPVVELSVWPVGHSVSTSLVLGSQVQLLCPSLWKNPTRLKRGNSVAIYTTGIGKHYSRGFPPPLQSQDCSTRGQEFLLALAVVDPLRTLHSGALESVHLLQVRRSLLVWGPLFEIQ